MKIKRLIRKNGTVQEDGLHTFHSFKEVFDYCYEHLRAHPPLYDCVVFKFKILDTNEQFNIVGGTKKSEITKETYIYADIDFIDLTTINMKEEEIWI